MHGQPNHREMGRNVFMSSAQGLATTLAAVAAFLGTPFFYEKTISWVQTLTRQAYGYGFEELVSIVWFALCAFLIFFVSRMTVGTALIVGGFAVMTRLL